MAKGFHRHLLRSCALALAVGALTWILTAGHAAWSLGIVLGYLDGGRIPMSPSIPVTWGSFLLDALPAFMLTTVTMLVAALVAPRRLLVLFCVVVSLLGLWFGLDQAAFLYQIDFGTTWAAGEAIKALIWHPVATPTVMCLSIIGSVVLARLFGTPSST